MSEYQIGKDIGDLQARVDELEALVRHLLHCGEEDLR